MDKLLYSDEEDSQSPKPSKAYTKTWVSDDSDSDSGNDVLQTHSTNHSSLPSVDELFTGGSDTRFNFKYVGNATKEFEVPTKGYLHITCSSLYAYGT